MSGGMAKALVGTQRNGEGSVAANRAKNITLFKRGGERLGNIF